MLCHYKCYLIAFITIMNMVFRLSPCSPPSPGLHGAAIFKHTAPTRTGILTRIPSPSETVCCAVCHSHYPTRQKPHQDACRHLSSGVWRAPRIGGKPNINTPDRQRTGSARDWISDTFILLNFYCGTQSDI